MNKQILFTEINTAALVEVEEKAVSENDVVVKTMYSSISCGTERANIMGNPNITPYSDKEKVSFPRCSGYSSSGIVIGKGENVKSVNVGDKVAMHWSVHKDINVLPEKHIVKVDNNVSMQAAALCHIGTFSMAALRKTKLEIGESAMIMGLGVLGLLAVQFAKAAGAVPVIAVDPNPDRRIKAAKMGADYTFDPYDDSFIENVKKITGGGVNTAIEVTGLGVGLVQCLDCMKRFGRIALLGCTRDKNFTLDYYRKVHGPGITIVGAHTLARPETESSPHWFTQRDDAKAILKLCGMGRINLDETIDEVYNPQNCREVYNRLISDKNFPAITQFDWSQLK